MITTYSPAASLGLRSFVTTLAASRLRAWVNHEHDERPTRAELRGWIQAVLDERLELHDEIASLTDELKAERAAHDDDVRELGDQRDAVRRKLRERTAERDAVHTDREAWRAEAVDRAVADARDAPVERTCAHGVTVRVTRRDGVR